MLRCRRNNCDQRLTLISCIAILAVGAFFFNMYNVNFARKKFSLSFIPANYQSCEQLLVNSSAFGIAMSPKYKLMAREFDDSVKNATAKEGIEGYSGQITGQYLIMHYLAGQPVVKTVCETGFNLGHSSFSYLTANDLSIVHSFDLGAHAYASKMSKYISNLFPTRFFIHFGDSTKTIPRFIQENPEFECDYIFVDGGHNYPVALADLKNFAKIANLKENIIIFDDYPTNWGQHFGKAWEAVKQEGIIKELMRCTFHTNYGLQRGYSIGRVLKRPPTSNATSKS